jgi:exodeoxyribonuclease VII large subunit
MDQGRQIFSISELNRDVRQLLERGFPLMWIQGEISNLTRASSGHWYFSLKDDKAQVQCAMFRNRNRLAQIKPENGQEVLVRARVTLYEPRGNYQLVCEHMEEAGIGALQRQFEQLKQKLSSEGLFATEHKQALPQWAQRIGVITSPSGAAIRDVISVLGRRFPLAEIIIYPVQVQGDAAPMQICRALGVAIQRAEVDVLLLTRGGGSLEDLWAFNDEQVARAIFDCPIPTVSAVGHEIDFTIADFVADVRAPTPSAAAELLSQDQLELQQTLSRLQQRLTHQQIQYIRQQQKLLTATRSRLQHPSRILHQQLQRVDELELRLRRGQQHRMQHRHHALQQAWLRLQQHSPASSLNQTSQKVSYLQRELTQVMRNLLTAAQHRLAKNSHTLQVISPLATLSRGYAIAKKKDKQNTLIKDSAQVSLGEEIEISLGRGRLISQVKTKYED